MQSSLSWISALLLTLDASATANFQSHPPMRPLPEPSSRAIPAGEVRFVDSKNGGDAQPGTKEHPWKTIAVSLGKLKPGDTLCLRGGTYYESVSITVSGTAEKPITIRAHPGELAILDSGIREFSETPATAWEPFPAGVPGEFRSVKSYAGGGGYGNFGDSMIPLHHYITIADLRSTNELWRAEVADRANDPVGIYCGPGTRRDDATERIHVRLAHTELAGLGELAYRGETDPRKLPLVIAGHDYALQIHKAAHIRIQDLVVRGAKRAAAEIADSEDIELDGVTLYGGQMALRTSHVRGLRVEDSAFRGHAAPWHSRAHHKYRASAGYLIIADGNDLDFDRCEFTDNHDFIALYGAYFALWPELRRYMHGVSEVKTPFVVLRDFYAGRCVRGPGGYGYLEASLEPEGTNDKRVSVVDLHDKRLRAYKLGLHLLDMQLTQGDLVEMVKRRAAHDKEERQ